MINYFRNIKFLPIVLLFWFSGCEKPSTNIENQKVKPSTNIENQKLKASNIESIVVFGDSFSDDGNVYKLTQGAYPGEAYYKGRFSNGPTWAEYLAQNLGIDPDSPTRFLDFAYGQAQITAPYTIDIIDKNTKKTSYSIPDLSQQISDYLENPVTNPEKTLFIVFIGTDDLLNLNDTTVHPEIIQKLLSIELTQIDRLIENSASNLLVINMRNLTFSPYVCTAAQNMVDHPHILPDAYKANFLKLIQDYNLAFSKQIAERNNINLFDVYAFDNAVHEKIENGGYSYEFNGAMHVLKNGGGICYIDHVEQSCYTNKGNYQDIVSPICKDPYEYFFYDWVHPTTYAHKIMADAVYAQFFPEE